ncbi:ATP-dependent DNA ligase [Microbacterium sp. T2.11-28]|uniref:ATP-dependent DNA ligase n=1 Tax=Microbacterium sp. T2.11-28 TaxID=3041169 RepID=UPI002477653F|nr:ATP-dependent DNA ligase [Microbacterium sp. T2.11-28]CAI9386558.1 Multifunctional non-homologous end joining protein LigD [Microbacterium sp. T2.11-28]
MASAAQTVEIGGRRLRVSNLDKVLYPATGTTKGEVIDYYVRIAPHLLPVLAGRPVTRKRWPEGVDQPPFFAKALEQGAPSWLRRHPIEHSSGAKEYPVVEETAALAYLAQVASLELHVPQWRFDRTGDRLPPDRVVLDLDPGPGVGLVECAKVARWCRLVLSDLGMDPVPVTSGSKGIHLYARLEGSRSSDEISAFAKELARALEADHPDLVVSQMSKSARPGKVFLDWSQNNGSKTTISPYSLRGRDEPTVAAPRIWEELDDPDLRQLRFDEVLARAAEIAAGAVDPLAALVPHRVPALDPYLAKRSADRTPEPMPSAPPALLGAGDSPRFVIQEHHATRLHHDLRLEREGVLVSWAVPRGVPDSPDTNHLAVMTEPHPLEYLTFHGEIPRGEYGAGTMTIWDTGTYELEKWRDDEVIFTLVGAPGGPLGSVRLALIRTSGDGEKSQWLLHRMKDPASRAPAGRHRPGRARAAAPAASTGDAPMLATLSTPGQATAAARRWAERSGEVWAEFKWDGVRAIGTWDGDRLRLRARSGTDITARYPELTDLDAGLGSEPCVIDGEIVALDSAGRPNFTRLQNRMHLTKPHEIQRETARTPVAYFLFDLLAHGGTDASALPLTDRRALLEQVAADAVDTIAVPPVSHDVDAALATARELALEGIVVKDPRSRYRRGVRSEEWLKVKLTQTQEVVIGGIRPGKGGRTGQIGSLLLGIPGDDGLSYVGRVGSGFSEATLARLEDLLTPLRTDVNPFVGVPAADASDALWVRPETVGEVEFAEFTPGGTLRHARWRGLRSDVAPGDVTR